MDDIIVKYFTGPRVLAGGFSHVFGSMQEIVAKHLVEEITKEQAEHTEGWKVYFIGDNVRDAKRFDVFGRLYTLTEESIDQSYNASLAENGGVSVDEVVRQSREITSPETLEFQTEPGLYWHTFSNYNDEGLLKKDESYTREGEIEFSTLYFYDDLNRLIRTESTDFDEGLYGYTTKYAYDEEGYLIREEVTDKGVTISLSEIKFLEGRDEIMLCIYGKNISLKKCMVLKKLSDGPEDVIWEFRDMDTLEKKIVDSGYRVVHWEKFDVVGRVELMKKYFYNRDGDLVAEEHFRGGISKLYIDKVYVYYYNLSDKLKTRKYYRASRHKLEPEHSGTERFFYDLNDRIIRKTKRLNLYGVNDESIKTYVYNEDGLLVEKKNTELDSRTVYFYNEKGEKTREESYFSTLQKPRAVEKWRYDDEGRVIENEYSSLRILY